MSFDTVNGPLLNALFESLITGTPAGYTLWTGCGSPVWSRRRLGFNVQWLQGSEVSLLRNGDYRTMKALFFSWLRSGFLLCFLSFACNLSSFAQTNDIQEWIAILREVDPGAQGNVEAGRAWQLLANSGAEALPTILAGLNDCSPLAANWLGTVVDAIAEKEVTRTGTLPVRSLEQFVLNTRHDSRARRRAFEWLTQVDQEAADRIIPQMLNDPGVEFRRDAVGRLLTEAEVLFRDDARRNESTALYHKALGGARHDDQIKTIAERLRELGQEVDLPRHFGFLMTWKLIAPFDNSNGKGFFVAYPPEKQIQPNASYEGKTGMIQWTDYNTDDDYGMVDLNHPFGKLKGVVGYASTEFTSEVQQEVQLRLGCKNAWKLWLNGKLLFERAEYHQGTRIDQYSLPALMLPGRNTILVKLCQNEMDATWTAQWQFQLRVCDASGTAILSTNRAHLQTAVQSSQPADNAATGSN